MLLLEELEELEPLGLPIGAAMIPGVLEGWLPMELLRLLDLLGIEPEVPGWLADPCGASVASDPTSPTGGGEVEGGAVGLRIIVLGFGFSAYSRFAHQLLHPC